MLRIQRRRGFHDDNNDFRRRDSLERSRLPPALRKHVFDSGQSFFGVIMFNHCKIDNRPMVSETLFTIAHFDSPGASRDIQSMTTTASGSINFPVDVSSIGSVAERSEIPSDWPEYGVRAKRERLMRPCELLFPAL